MTDPTPSPDRSVEAEIAAKDWLDDHRLLRLADNDLIHSLAELLCSQSWLAARVPESVEACGKECWDVAAVFLQAGMYPENGMHPLDWFKARIAALVESERKKWRRNAAQEKTQAIHVALGGDGEWVGRLPPQDPPNSGDLRYDALHMAKALVAKAALLSPSPAQETAPEDEGDRDTIRTALGLLSSMVNGGEAHSDRSRAALSAAFDALALLSPAPAPLAWRPDVVAFAHLMERELRANDHKPGWKKDHWMGLWNRLLEESKELHEAPHKYSDRACSGDREKEGAQVAKEAADVANFAMMIADVCGPLTPDGFIPREEKVPPDLLKWWRNYTGDPQAALNRLPIKEETDADNNEQ